MNHNWSRHIGVYGICVVQQQLLVVTKNRGPYIHRFDLPGGKMEENETYFLNGVESMSNWIQLLITMILFNVLLYFQYGFKHFTLKKFLGGVVTCVPLVLLFETIMIF
ncbi:hypothetical protein [Brevibacillus sp. SIMBA_076]|uniref:hypothetical protein n=1 Tax=Brevibacillus sp. SIMBA_076 TaxID=3085814 RepID=UPI003979EF65